MKPMIILVFLLASEIAFADNWHKNMERDRFCILNAENAYQHYERASALWLQSTSGFSLAKAFSKLNTLVEAHVAEIIVLAKILDYQNLSAEQAMRKFRELEEHATGVQKDAVALSKEEAVFLSSAAAVDEAFAIVGDKLTTIVGDCSNVDPELLKPALEGVSEIRESVGYMQGFVAAASERRGKFLNTAVSGARILLIGEYARKTNQSISEARQKIESVLLADRMLDRIEAWWATVQLFGGMSQGAGRGSLQYLRPLAQMKRDEETGLSLKHEIDRATGLDIEIQKALKANIDGKLGALRYAVRQQSELGAEGNLRLQKLTNERRMQIIDQYAAGCREEIERFNSIAGSENESIDHLKADAAYLDVVFGCRKGN